MGNNGIDDYEKYREIAGLFDGHGDAVVQQQRDAHRPMEHIQIYTVSHWMPP